jgi:thymidylate synthase (FAD)
MKHQVGCSWNEVSGRYVDLGQDYWEALQRGARRARASSRAQAESFPREVQLGVQHIYADALNTVATAYELLLQMGVCKEQARAILPVSVISECYWSCSLHALIHFLKLRLDEHAQLEIREYAQAVSELVESIEGMDRVLEVCLG